MYIYMCVYAVHYYVHIMYSMHIYIYIENLFYGETLGFPYVSLQKGL